LRLYQLRNQLRKLLPPSPVTSAQLPPNIKLVKRHQYRHVKNTLCDVNINQISHICDQCGKSFRSRYGMQVHTTIKHQQQFRFTCGVCNKGFHQLWNFRGHLSSHHSALKVTCETCGKVFNYK